MNLNMETENIIRSDQIFRHFIIQSQIMRKLNPMNRPSTPPQSATREPNGKDFSSVKTSTESLRNRTSPVPLALFTFPTVIASSVICLKCTNNTDTDRYTGNIFN